MALIEPNFNIEKHSIHRHDLGKEIAMLISMFSLIIIFAVLLLNLVLSTVVVLIGTVGGSCRGHFSEPYLHD